MQKKAHLDSLSVAALLVLCVSWGGQQVAVKLIVDDVSPVMQAAIRSIGATILVAGWMLVRRQRFFERDGTLWWGLAAGLLFAIEFLLIYWGLGFTNASRAVIFLYLAPFVVAIGTHLFIPGEKSGPVQFAGMLVAFVGIVVAFGESFSLPSKTMLIGDAMLVAAAIAWGATTVLIKAGPLTAVPASKTLLYQLAVSAVLLPLGSLALGEPGIVRLSPLAITSIAYQTVWVASITYLTWFWLIRHYPGARLASFTFLTPIFGVLAGWFVLDEPVSASLVAALILVALGVYLVNRPSDLPADLRAAQDRQRSSMPRESQDV
jgi:drug/metabolite transporter (DMT)-like permease